MEITEQELQRRIKNLESKTKVAGPNDPIYSSGLTVNSFHVSIKSMNASLKSTVGASQHGSLAQAMPKQQHDLQNRPEDPELGAVRANEAARSTKQSTTGKKNT